MLYRFAVTLILSASVALGVGAGTLLWQLTEPRATGTQENGPDRQPSDGPAISGIGSGVDGAQLAQSQAVDRDGVVRPPAVVDSGDVEADKTVEVYSTSDGSMQSIRGIKGIDTVMLQNLEAVLRMQAPPLPPQEGGGGGRAAAALLTMENDQPPDPEAEPDGREELTQIELDGS